MGALAVDRDRMHHRFWMGDKMGTFYIDGEFVEASQAVVPVDDLALLRGYGVFDFMRTYGGRPFAVGEHVQRLKRSCELIGLAFPWSTDDVIRIVMDTLGRNDYEESNVRLVVTGGASADSITPEGKPRLLVMVTPILEMPAEWYSQGASVVTVGIERFIPGAKTINYIPAIMAMREARRRGAIEALYRDARQRVLEGTTTNLFAVVDGVLTTPSESILPGITRKTVLELLEGREPVKLGPIMLDALYRAEEVFLTASNKEVVPIVRVDEQVIGDGKPGPRTRRVMELFADHTRRFAARANQG